MSTFKEQLEKLTSLKHRLAVWEAIYDQMDSLFIKRDGRTATKAIRVPNCVVETVAEETVEDVLQNIAEGPIAELKEQIKEIEDEPMVVIDKIKVQA